MASETFMTAMGTARIILGFAMIGLTAASGAGAQAPPARAEFITLGTGGGPMIRRERSEPANAVMIGDAVYLFDVGSGVERQMVGAKLAVGQVRAIFVSHHHVDHNADLGQLIASRWMFNHYAPLPVIGPPGTKQMIQGIGAALRATELAPIASGGPGKPPLLSTVAPVDLAPQMDTPTEVYKDANIRVLAVTNEHYHFKPGSEQATFARSYSFRIETAGRVFAYTGDTGPSANVERLAKGADLLVSEVIDLDRMVGRLRAAPEIPPAALPGMIAHMRDDHLTPSAVGKLAAAAGVKEVVLTHLSPGMDGETDLSGYTKGIAPLFPGKVRVARDLDRF